MPFITIDEISQYVGDGAAEVLVSSGRGKESTAHEAAQCISRYIAGGDNRMHQANEEFNRVYGHGGRLSVRSRDSGRSL